MTHFSKGVALKLCTSLQDTITVPVGSCPAMPFTTPKSETQS